MNTQTSAGNPVTGTRTRMKVRRRIPKNYLLFIVLVAPALLYRAFTSVYPIGQTAVWSLYKLNPMDGAGTYTGLGNFNRMISDFVIQQSVTYTIMFVLGSTLLEIIVGLALALLLNANFRGRKFARTISLIPWAIPLIVAAMGFRWLFDDQFGLITDLVYRVVGERYAWLIDPWGARIIVILTNVWKNAPFIAMLFLAGLQGVPNEVYEAAKVDGASPAGIFRHITLPLISGLVTTTTMFFTIWQLASFDIIYGMTQGGPGFATSVLAYQIYEKAFHSMNFGYASAISMLLFLFVLVIGLLGLAAFKRQETSF